MQSFTSPLAVLVVLSLACTGWAADWTPVLTENFDGPDWAQGWKMRGAAKAHAGALLSGGREFRADLTRVFAAPAIRVEYDAAMTAAGVEGDTSDLSCFIGPVFFQFGGEANQRTGIRMEREGWEFPVAKPPLFEIGKTYRVTAEVNGRLCRLTVDGKPAGEYVLAKPLKEAAVSLYSWSGTARFDNLAIATKDAADPAPDLDDRVARKVVEEKRREEEEARKVAPAAMTLGELRVRAAMHGIAFEWDLTGDGNHNAACALRYRRQGVAEWKQALPLLRIAYRGWYSGRDHQAFRFFNMLSGSILFLEPGATYEVELAASDPDGGAETKTLTVATRPTPSLAAALRTLHVTPGEGGGDGSKENPFRGLAAADEAAKPGDLFLLHKGEYPGVTLKKGGAPGAYVAYRPAGDGPAVIKSALAFETGHLWFEGLTFEPTAERNEQKDFGGVRGKGHGHHDIVVTRNTFRNCRYALSNTDRSWDGDPKSLNTGWSFTDNVVEGGPWTEYGLRVYLLADADVAYNRFTTTLNKKGGDGVSLRFCLNIDVHHNDLREIDDDTFEPDSAYGNIRIWVNRSINPRYQGVSFQPMLCSPWYIVRNEFLFLLDSRTATPFKTNVFDRFVVVNNVFVVRSRYGQYRADAFLRSFSRNNLWVHIYDNRDEKTNPTGAIWSGEGDQMRDGRYTIHGQSEPDWRTDVDYDGFAWEGEGMGPYPFWWMGRKENRFRDLESFAKSLGIEQHAVRLDRRETFEIEDLTAYAAEAWSPRRLALKAGSKAIDAGAPVPNLCEDFEGKAPDLGPYEFGRPAAHYGPRP